MWHFVSPDIVFGEDSLSYLCQLEGRQAYIVTDAQMVKLGFLDLVTTRLKEASIPYQVFSDVEPEPSLATVIRGADVVRQHNPDWIIGLGGGSVIDAAKAIWVLYERPDISPESINPFESLSLRQKARLIAIPTTSGTGSDSNWGFVLTDTQACRKLGLGSREVHADIAIVDPIFCVSMPPALTADGGMDALTHAIEAYSCQWSNDFTDGLALQAIKLIFNFLPRAFRDGSDLEAREKMHNAASIAGLAFGNSMTAIAHSMGHSLGALFHIPHGRSVGLFLPYTIEFAGNAAAARYADILAMLPVAFRRAEKSSTGLAQAVRKLGGELGMPPSIEQAGIERQMFEDRFSTLVANADMDTQTVMAPRIPTVTEFSKLFRYAYEGRKIDF